MQSSCSYSTIVVVDMSIIICCVYVVLFSHLQANCFIYTQLHCNDCFTWLLYWLMVYFCTVGIFFIMNPLNNTVVVWLETSFKRLKTNHKNELVWQSKPTFFCYVIRLTKNMLASLTIRLILRGTRFILSSVKVFMSKHYFVSRICYQANLRLFDRQWTKDLKNLLHSVNLYKSSNEHIHSN